MDLDDIIQTSTDVPHPDDYREPRVNYPELIQEELDELHQRYENPMTLGQINMMRQLMIDSEDEEEVFLETVRFHDDDEDDEDRWANIAGTVTEKHLIRNHMKTFCPLCEQENHTVVECQDYYQIIKGVNTATHGATRHWTVVMPTTRSTTT